jgi:ketosteroid isomerase-like protein
MKLVFVVTMLSAALCSSAPGQSKRADVEQTVMSIEKEMLDALLKGDSSALERYLADSYVSTGPDGSVEDKAQNIADLKSGDLKLQSATLDDPKVRVYGDTAIVTYASADKGTYKGKDITGKTRWTDVFVKRNGRWQLVASQGSRVVQQ